MSIKDFMEEEHPAMFVSSDGKIGRIGGVSFIRIHVYVKEAPRWIPDSLWYWLADRITHTVNDMATQGPGRIMGASNPPK